MKSNIPENVVTVLKEIGMTHDQAGWNCHGTYVLLHKALEKVAVARKITFDQPKVLESDSGKRIASLLVSGHMGDKSEWSIGEASPSNNKNSYPFAMAEIFMQFMPTTDNRADLVGFWKNNKKALDSLKELSAKDYEDVEVAFKKRAEEIITDKGENDGK